MTQTCYNTDDLHDASNIASSTTSNQVIGAYVTSSSVALYDQTIDKCSLYLARPSTMSGGSFALGVWDSSGDNKVQSATFSTSAMAVGGVDDVEKLTKDIDTVTIEIGDTLGIITLSAPTGSGELKVGMTINSAPADWKRAIFIQGSSPAGGLTENRALGCCVTTSSGPSPSSSGTLLPPPIATVRL